MTRCTEQIPPARIPLEGPLPDHQCRRKAVEGKQYCQRHLKLHEGKGAKSG